MSVDSTKGDEKPISGTFFEHTSSEQEKVSISSFFFPMILTRWAPHDSYKWTYINHTTPKDGQKINRYLGLFHPYKWSY